MTGDGSHVFLETATRDGVERAFLVFYWRGAIDCSTADAVGKYVDGLLRMAEQQEDEGLDAVFVWNTPGGEFAALEAILEDYKALRRRGVRLWTVADGEAMSAGLHLVVSGHKGRRFALRGSVLDSHAGGIDKPHNVLESRRQYFEEGMTRRIRATDGSAPRRRELLRALAHALALRHANIAARAAVEAVDGWQVETLQAASTALSAINAGKMVADRAIEEKTAEQLFRDGLVDGLEPPDWLAEVVSSARGSAGHNGLEGRR